MARKLSPPKPLPAGAAENIPVQSPRATQPRKSGRRLKLTKAVLKALVHARRAGLPITTCAACASISHATLLKWMHLGRQDAEAGVLTVYSDLVTQVAQAEADRVNESLERIRKAAVGEGVVEKTITVTKVGDGQPVTVVRERRAPADWRADAWVLERLDPASFATRSRTEVSGPDGGPVTVATWADLMRAADADPPGTTDAEPGDHDKG